MTTVTAQVTDTRRLANSASGNPRWEVTLDNGWVIHTGSDSAIAYEIDNPEYRQQEHTFTLRNGNIVEVQPW